MFMRDPERKIVTLAIGSPSRPARFELGPATVDQLDEIVALSRTTPKFEVSRYTGSELDYDELAFWIEDDRSIVLVACVSNVVTGYANGVIISPKWFFFDGFLIAQEKRGYGLGQELYAYLVDICRARGVQFIQGLVTKGRDSSLEYWLRQDFEAGKVCTWVEHWINA